MNLFCILKVGTDPWKCVEGQRENGREEIERCIRMVVDRMSKAGEELRKNSVKWKQLARSAMNESGASDTNLNKFVDDVNNQVDQVPLFLDKLSPSQLHKDGFSFQSILKEQKTTLFGQSKPFEQFFGISCIESGRGYVYEKNRKSRTVSNTHKNVSCGDPEVEMLQNLRCCIVKFLRLEGSNGYLTRMVDSMRSLLIWLLRGKNLFMRLTPMSLPSYTTLMYIISIRTANLSLFQIRMNQLQFLSSQFLIVVRVMFG